MAKAKQKSKGQVHGQKKVKRSISTVLLSCLLPITIVGIVVIILLITTKAEGYIVDTAKQDLRAETSENANAIETEIAQITSTMEGYASTLETVVFADHDAILKYIQPSADYDEVPMSHTGIYIGFSDDSYLFANGTIQADDWFPTERGWYTEGIGYDTFTVTEPYVDAATDELCVTFARGITLADGETGVIAFDVFLTSIQEEVGELTPMSTGGTLLITQDTVISYFDYGYEGQAIADVDDDFLNEVLAQIQSNNEVPQDIKSENGNDYFISTDTVEGTNWYLVSSVESGDVLSDVNSLKKISYGLMLLIILALAVAIVIVVSKVVTKPVRTLADKILMISNGDFTVKLPKGGKDEIGLINDEMRDYVQTMNTTIEEIQNRAAQLQSDSTASRDASGKMTGQARDQSISMDQIQEAMDGMSRAVEELANNATELAGSVSELTDKGHSTNDVMLDLVGKADLGQKDMVDVKDNMSNITRSMAEMNDVVKVVDESAKKITDIVEMIDSIAEQTNLLSLNASIEAARAGEAGKGFAVVASEIGTLANDSSSAAQEIAVIIHEITTEISRLAEKSQSNTKALEGSVGAVNKAGDSFNEILTELNGAAGTMREMIQMMNNVDEIATNVAAISEEQSASAEEVTATVEDLASMAEEIANESKGVEDSANNVSDSAISINDSLSQFKILNGSDES